jgi:hypothetical protein
VSVQVPSGFPANIPHALLFSKLVLHVLPIAFSLTLSFELYLAESISYKVPHYTVSPTSCISFLLGQNMLFFTLISNTLGPYFSSNVIDQVSCPYRITIYLYKLKEN